jgi:uncharacterized membrane protein YesL
MKKRKNRDSLALPVTYWAEFCLAYRTNFVLLAKLSLFLAFFALPSLATLVIQGLYEGTMSADGEEVLAILSLRRWFGFMLIPDLAILGLGLSGAFYVLLKFVWNEGVLFWHDFWVGIKKNWKSALAISLSYGTIISLFNFALNCFSTDDLFLFYVFAFVVFVIILLILISMYLYSLTSSLIYAQTTRQMIKNSFSFIVASFPKTILAIVGSLLPFMVCYFVSVPLVLYITILLYALIGFGNGVLIILLCHLSTYDRLVNMNDYPSLYHKGLFREETKTHETGN